MTKKDILKKYNIKEHNFKHLKKKYNIQPIKIIGNKHIYDEVIIDKIMSDYTPKSFWSEKEIQFLVEHYPSGGVELCRKYIDRDDNLIKAKAYSLGLYLNSDIKNKIYKKSMERREQNKTQEDFRINYVDMMNLKDNQVCYFLGFLWADGCIKDNRIFMTLLKNDMSNSLEKILPKYGEWNFSDVNDKYRKFNVYCKPYYNWLVDMGYLNKSKLPPNKLLSNMPKNNIKYFLRGLFDGDGSFPLNKKRNVTSFSITSTYNYDWSFLTEILKDIGVTFSIRNVKKNKSSFSEVRVFRVNDTLKIGEYVYGNHWDGIGLERKMVKSLWNRERPK